MDTLVTSDILSYVYREIMGLLSILFPHISLSLVLQPLDVSVFGSFKNMLERDIHDAGRLTTVFDSFMIARILSSSNYDSHTPSIILTGFVKTGVWYW